MNNDRSQSGMWLLLIYSIFVGLGVLGSVALLFVFEKISPDFSGIIFILALFAALIVPWPLAVWMTEKSPAV